MIQPVIFRNQGSGYITDGEQPEGYRALPFEIVNEGTVCPGEKTTLGGFFNVNPATYVGRNDKTLLFYLGSDEGKLFPKHYYQIVYLSTKTRIVLQLRHSGLRDYNYIKGKWK